MTIPKTDAELNARCAEIMGWILVPSSGSNGDYYAKAELESKPIVFVENYSPVTKIKQALEFAIKMRVSVMFEPLAEGEGFGLEIYIPNSKVYSYGLTLSDCARKIVETVLEVEGG